MMSNLRRCTFIGAALLCAASAFAQAPLLPEAFPQYLSSTGAPLAGGSLTFDAAGTTTPQAVYSDSSLSTPLANPYTLDAGGRPPTGIYLSAVAYKIILKDASGTTIRTQDNVYGATYLASLAVAPTIQTTTSTGTVNDFATSSLTSNLIVLRANNPADLTLTGFTAATTAGQQLLILSIGAGNVFLAHQNTGSAAANRAINFATSGNTPLASTVGIAKYVYDTTTSRWRLIVHEQGAWITPTFAAGNFTANNAMTWTVGAGAVAVNRYRLSGRTLTYAYDIGVTTIGGTASTALQIANGAWGGFTAAVIGNGALEFVNGGGAASNGVARVAAAGTSISLFIDRSEAANWTLGASAIVTGLLLIEVQ